MKIKLSCLLSLLILFSVWSLPAQALSPPQKSKITIKALGSSDLSLTGMYGAASIWIPFPSNWVLDQEVMVDVAYIASPLLDREQSTLTILANDRPITSMQPVADGTEHHFSLAIPVDQLQGAGVTLHFQGYLRLTDLPCEVSNNPAQWLTILDQTSLTITAGTNTAVPNLADLPQAIVVENALDTPPPVIFILPDDPDEVTLTTAAQVAARLGAGSRGSFAPFGAETVSTLTETQNLGLDELLAQIRLKINEAFIVKPMVTYSITEDMATAMNLHSLGWKSVFYPKILAYGLAPEDLGSVLGQRFRWAAGTIQVLVNDNPLFKRGLSWSQRLQYFTTTTGYFSGFASVVYLFVTSSNIHLNSL